METGRALDALVATHVMGWKNFRGHYYPASPHPEANILGHVVPPYSTDIAAAWQVVEKLKERSDLFPQISWIRVHDNQYQHRCEIWQNDPPNKLYGWLADVYADTAPLAICLAALAVMGVEV